MGGALTLLAAVHVPEADAGVVWYGYPPLEYVDASKIKMPLMAHWAMDDAPFPIANVDELEEKLREARACTSSSTATRRCTPSPTRRRWAHNRLPITEYNAEAAAAGLGRARWASGTSTCAEPAGAPPAYLIRKPSMRSANLP